MSYKSENWKEKLEQVRSHIALKEGSVEKTADEIISEDIENDLLTGFEEDVKVVEDEITEELVLEASMGDMIKKVFNTDSETEAMGIAKLLNMTDVKVALAMQKQNPNGFKKTTFGMGADNKQRDMIKDKDLMKMFKKAGVSPLKDSVEVEEEKPVKESVEKSAEKLVEKNMLGRLAKQLHLTTEGKQKMFDYFEKGELEQ
jgi:hypothetical protein|tara:strand:- start:566 stop:1168 length:603 start_codon:yes stop_codon:yes gene_type:complete